MSENNDITTVTPDAAPTPAADKSYKVVLKDFEGPLDLLLSMVKERKINIEDFFLSDITEQYLSYMDQTEELDMEQAADFIEVAASLIEIKSRALLPVEKTDEEENEDLRPTQTTIQYKTAGAASVVEEGKIKTSAKAKRAGLNKRDKIFIAVALTVIIALFTLIIVNSAIISGLSGEVSSLQYNLGTAKEAFMRAQAEKDAYMNDANLFEIVSKFAYSHGMVLK